MFKHETVLKQEIVDMLSVKLDGTYVDCTVGGGGHSQLIATLLGAKGTLVGIDQDTTALQQAEAVLRDAKCKVLLVKGNFAQLSTHLLDLDITEVNGFVFDLGVSSPQLDHVERGFSYHHDAPLDMRMDKEQTWSGFHLVNQWSEAEIAKVLHEYGEERFSRRIAREIVRARQEGLIETTLQLVGIIKAGIPTRFHYTGTHPARRSFQAIRIAVNRELDVLSAALTQATDLLAPEGRLCVITFHSLEDRICKQYFKQKAQGCICPPNFPMCACKQEPFLRLVTKKPILPSIEEVEKNNRARSAKLRVVEKI